MRSEIDEMDPDSGFRSESVVGESKFCSEFDPTNLPLGTGGETFLIAFV